MQRQMSVTTMVTSWYHRSAGSCFYDVTHIPHCCVLLPHCVVGDRTSPLSEVPETSVKILLVWSRLAYLNSSLDVCWHRFSDEICLLTQILVSSPASADFAVTLHVDLLCSLSVSALTVWLAGAVDTWWFCATLCYVLLLLLVYVLHENSFAICHAIEFDARSSSTPCSNMKIYTTLACIIL